MDPPAEATMQISQQGWFASWFGKKLPEVSVQPKHTNGHSTQESIQLASNVASMFGRTSATINASYAYMKDDMDIGLKVSKISIVVNKALKDIRGGKDISSLVLSQEQREMLDKMLAKSEVGRMLTKDLTQAMSHVASSRSSVVSPPVQEVPPSPKPVVKTTVAPPEPEEQRRSVIGMDHM